MKPAKTIQTLSVLSLLAFGFLVSANKASAQTAFGLSAIPPRLEVTVKPDEVQTAIIKVRNESNAPRIISTEISDFIVTDDKGTPVQIKTTNENNRWAASSWIQVSPTNFRLAPGEIKSLVLTVMPPANALPGGHYAMVLHAPQNLEQVNSNGASLQAEVGTLVYVTIPGDINQNALVEKFNAPVFSEFGPINFKSAIKNLSDIHIAPAGNITVTNWLGGKTAVLPLENTNIFPNTSRDFTNLLNKKWLFGRYTANLNAAYGNTGKAVAATLIFWVIPWRLITLLIATIAIIVAIVIINKNRPQTPQENTSEAKVEELEKELEALKRKYKDRK